jgi:hypothetical protein
VLDEWSREARIHRGLVEVRRVRREDAVTPHFFPYVTPWKSVYTVKFPYNILITDERIIEEDTQEIKLVITSVLGTAEMDWENLNRS